MICYAFIENTKDFLTKVNDFENTIKILPTKAKHVKNWIDSLKDFKRATKKSFQLL